MFVKITILSVIATLYLCNVAAGADVDCSKRPERMNPKTCCPVPDLITSEIKEKCKQYGGSSSESTETSNESSSSSSSSRPRPPHHHHHHHPCFMSCAVNETGIMNENTVDEAKLQNYLTSVVKVQNEMVPIITAAFKTCAARSEEFKAKMKNNPRPSPPPGDRMARCNPGSGMIMMCVFGETMDNCPSSIWNNTQQCNDMRDFMKSCKPKPGMPPKAQ
ncbi:general odorant-binding protein 67-like [Teleopsis dalmanni]|uniref:general odorant-binding protein 67-like n=1 Tax=Teleopsis dalmanni TaxID=139649 RepID=UPI0018CDE1D9|nr:general odorant-binding protein 67-like [Teleopsis dalmanni]